MADDIFTRKLTAEERREVDCLKERIKKGELEADPVGELTDEELEKCAREAAFYKHLT